MRRARAPELCLAAGLFASLILAVAAARNPTAVAEAWLPAYLFWLSLPIGALFLDLVLALIGGRWGEAVRPPLAALMRSLPVLALLSVPVLLGARRLYPWGSVSGEERFSLVLFDLRAVAYLALWSGIALAAARFGRADGSLPPAIAWPGLIVLFVTTSLAGFDWVMALEPGWTSSVFGLLVTTGWVVCAVACIIALAAAGAAGRTAPDQLDALARLLLALVMLWAYLSAIQFIVIWESNLSSEISWYLKRVAGGWRLVAAAVVAFQFLVPFFLLLWRPLRRSRRTVLSVAIGAISARLLETWWLTVPDLPRPFDWLEPAAVVAIGGCVLFVIGRELHFASLPPLKVNHGRS